MITLELREGAYQTRSTPDVSRRSPLCAEDHLWASVLPGLNVIGKVVVDPGGY
jgi:hypothetical protein